MLGWGTALSLIIQRFVSTMRKSTRAVSCALLKRIVHKLVDKLDGEGVRNFSKEEASQVKGESVKDFFETHKMRILDSDAECSEHNLIY